MSKVFATKNVPGFPDGTMLTPDEGGTLHARADVGAHSWLNVGIPEDADDFDQFVEVTEAAAEAEAPKAEDAAE